MIGMFFVNPFSGMGTGEVCLNLGPITLTEPQVTGLCIVAAPALFIVGDTNFKWFVDRGEWRFFLIGTSITFLASILYLPIIKQGLSSGFLLVTVLMTLGIVLVDLVLFGQAITIRKAVAIALIFISLFLIEFPINQDSTSKDTALVSGGKE